jgi:hypothetical protein
MLVVANNVNNEISRHGNNYRRRHRRRRRRIQRQRRQQEAMLGGDSKRLKPKGVVEVGGLFYDNGCSYYDCDYGASTSSDSEDKDGPRRSLRSRSSNLARSHSRAASSAAFEYIRVMGVPLYGAATGIRIALRLHQAVDQPYITMCGVPVYGAATGVQAALVVTNKLSSAAAVGVREIKWIFDL